MKKFLSLLSVIFLVGFVTSCSDNDEGVQFTVTFGDLPQTAQDLLNKYFQGEGNVEKVELDEDSDVLIYEVETKDGFEIVFNSRGEWQQIDAPDDKTVPDALIPEQILVTLNERYNGYGVIEINTVGENYHVVLNDMQGGASIERILNQSGEILS